MSFAGIEDYLLLQRVRIFLNMRVLSGIVIRKSHWLNRLLLLSHKHLLINLWVLLPISVNHIGILTNVLNLWLSKLLLLLLHLEVVVDLNGALVCFQDDLVLNLVKLV